MLRFRFYSIQVVSLDIDIGIGKSALCRTQH